LIFKRILATTDGTEVSLRAVEAAAQMVHRYRAELLLLTVVPVPQHVALTSSVGTLEGYIERMAQDALGPALAVLKRERVGAEIKVVPGPPAESIVQEARFSRAELVVMGRRRRNEPKDLVLGSVSDRVARNIDVPLLLVP